MADNSLESLPPLDGATSLHSLWAYGNRLQTLPAHLGSMPSLRRLWVEDNPGQLQEHAAALGKNKTQLATPDGQPLVIGLDAANDVTQIVDPPSPESSICLTTSTRIVKGPGYFKLAKGPLPHKTTFTSADGRPCARALVVAFGSAPGTPNWGGLLSRVYAAAAKEGEQGSSNSQLVPAAQFDVLYVVDPCRAWYGGGGDGWAQYERRLRRCVEGYARVVMLGDSMGATAALLASPLATHVLAFCPQVPLPF